ncbi:hypothetical protein V2G26_000818 [Clonostachys chloroleuca]
MVDGYSPGHPSWASGGAPPPPSSSLDWVGCSVGSADPGLPEAHQALRLPSPGCSPPPHLYFPSLSLSLSEVLEVDRVSGTSPLLHRTKTVLATWPLNPSPQAKSPLLLSHLDRYRVLPHHSTPTTCYTLIAFRAIFLCANLARQPPCWIRLCLPFGWNRGYLGPHQVLKPYALAWHPSPLDWVWYSVFPR